LLALAGEDLADLEVGRFLDLPGETTVINEMVTTVKAKGEARGQTFQTNERCVFRGRDDYRLVKRNLVTGATLSLSVLGRSAEIDKRNFEGELSEHGNVERIDRFDRMRDEVIVAFLELHRRFSKYLQLQRTKEDDLSVEYLGSRFPPPAGEGAALEVQALEARVVWSKKTGVPHLYSLKVAYRNPDGTSMELDLTTTLTSKPAPEPLTGVPPR